MNPETKSFVVGSLVREIKIETNQTMIEEFLDQYDDVQREENPYQEDFDDINETLNTEFALASSANLCYNNIITTTL